MLLFDIVSVAIFSYGTYYYYQLKNNLKTKDLFLIFSLCFIGLDITALPVVEVYSYITINRLIALISIGLILLSPKFSDFISNILLFISGILVGSLTFIMITNTPLIFVLLLLIIITYGFKLKSTYYRSLYLIIGVVLSIVIYFLFIESFNTFYNNLTHNANIVVNNKIKGGYDIYSLINWIKTTFTFILFDITFYSLAFIGILYLIKDVSKYKAIILAFYIVMFVLIYYYKYVYQFHNNFAGMSTVKPLMVVSVGAFIYSFLTQKNNYVLNWQYLIICIITPILLSFGSNVPFETRVGAYVIFILPIAYIICKSCIGIIKLNHILYSIIILYSINHMPMLKSSNWSNIVYVNQNISIKNIDINQSLYLDNNRINELQFLKNYLEKKSVVVVSTSNLFGHVYLLDLKLSSYNFQPQQLSNNTIKTSYFIEDKMEPFSAEFLKEHISLNCKEIANSDRFTIYKVHE